MASINSLMSSSSTSSIYGTRNVISGLASGLDTESLIENVVSGYKTKLTQLQQERTMVEWQQEKYRSIISKLSGFTSNYASYSSSNNLMSRSFFTNTVNVTTNGANKDMVSASGKTSSNVKLLGVQQLATAATYTISGSSLSNLLKMNPDNTVTASAADSFDLAGDVTVGTLKGTLTLKYGGNTSVALKFDETETYANNKELAEAIQKKLDEATMTIGSSTYKAGERIKVNYNESTGEIAFEDIGKGGNGVSIKSVSGSLDALGIGKIDSENPPKSFKADASGLTKTGTASEFLAGGKLSITLDGETKTITLPDADNNTDFLQGLQDAIDKAFGKDASGNSKLKVDTDSGKLTFSTTQAGSSFKVTANSAAVGEALGIGSAGVSSALNTELTLEDMLGSNLGDAAVKAGETIPGTDKKATEDLYAFTVNGFTGYYSKDTTLSTILSDINSSDEAGVSAVYSKTTNQLQFTARETGANSKVEFGGLAETLFGDKNATITQGQDAILSVEVNGMKLDMTRASNTVEIDGLTMNLKGTFGYKAEGLESKETTNNGTIYKAAQPITMYDQDGTSFTASWVNEDGEYVSEYGYRLAQRDKTGAAIRDVNGEIQYVKGTAKSELDSSAEAVTFTATADAEKIVGVVKQMVEDYNAMVSEIKTAYSTMPEKDSTGKEYKPLTDEDKAGMSESTIKSYEDKAKAGMLFADRDLSNLYSRIVNTLTGANLESVGITLNYSDGLTTLKLDEAALTKALEDDADKVADVLAGDGRTTGFITRLKAPLDNYGSTTGTKGILVEKAGSTLSPSSLYTNELYNKIGDFDKQISKVEETISDKIDFYTTKFTYLEQLIAQMNNQSGMLMGLMGGY